MRHFRVALLAALLLTSSCVKENLDATGGGPQIQATASLPSATKVCFQEQNSPLKLKARWEKGDELIGFKEDGGDLSFSVSEVDAKTGVATLVQNTKMGFSVGEKVYLVYAPSNSVTDFKGGVMEVDFSNQGAGRIPALMFSEATVSEGPSLHFHFRNACAVVGVIRPAIEVTNINRSITKIIVSGHEVVSSGKVCVKEGSLVFEGGVPSNFITREITSKVEDGGSGLGTFKDTILVAVPPCKVDKVTFLDEKQVIYSYNVGGKQAEASKYCRIADRTFSKVTLPINTDVCAGGVYWADRNLGATTVSTGSTGWGNLYRWGDPTIIYTEKTADAVTFDSSHQAGFTQAYTGECYWDGSKYTKYTETDGKTVLDPVDDIVQLTFPGSGWRMATYEEFKGIIDDAASGKLKSENNNKTYVKYIDSEGNVLNFNRNTKGGKAYSDLGRHWTSTLYTDKTGTNAFLKGHYFRVNKTNSTLGGSDLRYIGYAVRPVRPTGIPGGGGGGGCDEPDLPNYNEGKSVVDRPDWQDISIDYTNLTAANHPRLMLRNKDVKGICTAVSEGTNPYLTKLHNAVLKSARALVKNTTALTYDISSGGRLLQTSRKAIYRIADLAYAYRITGEERYLEMADWNISTVCDFPDWHPAHFLDVGEMAVAVAIGYDWLYNDLSEATREKAKNALKTFALEAGEQYGYAWTGNWNQVCLGGLMCAALAVYEDYPELADKVIRKALSSNAKAIYNIYSPSGAFPEGPGYWEYGTTYQGMLNLACETVLGTDFELPSTEGFDNTGWYYVYELGPTGLRFNYSDSGEEDETSIGLWYMAYKHKRGSYLYQHIHTLDDDTFVNEKYNWFPLILAYKMGSFSITAPTGHMFKANGKNPIMMCRTGWGSNDFYLALKGGTPNLSHAHLDIGEVVFDAWGTRWFKDFTYSTNYEDMEAIFRASGLDQSLYGSREAGSYRWKTFQLHNKRHSTLTIDDKDQWPYGCAQITKIDEDGRIGGYVDLTDCFYNQLATGNRTAVIKDGSYLEITDVLTALSGNSAHVRFVCASNAVPTIQADGIVLTDGNGVQMKIVTDAPSPVFKTWSVDPWNTDDYTSPFTETESLRQNPLDGYLCGYEYDIPAGTKSTVVTTLKKQ